MKSIIHLRRTFRALRQLPLEVSFEQVELWVQHQQIAPPPKSFLQKLRDWWKDR